MRATLRMFVPLLAIMAVFVVIVLLLARGARLDYGFLAGRLHHLKHDHAVLANLVLNLRQAQHYEAVSAIVTAKNRITVGAEQLKELNWHGQASDDELRKLFDAYSQTVGELTDHVEQFKTANAVEHNSLHYLPQLADAAKGPAESGSAEASLAIDRLLWAVAVHLIYESTASREDVDAKLQILNDLKLAAEPPAARQFDRLMDHVRKVLETRPLVNEHLNAIVTSPADHILTEASLMVAEKNDQALGRQQQLQLALVVVGSTLVGYIGALLWMLRLSVRELDEANQALEVTVEKRVAELKLTNQQLFQAQKL